MTRKMFNKYLIISLFLSSSLSYSQNLKQNKVLNWIESDKNSGIHLRPSFSNAFYPDTGSSIPYYYERFEFPFVTKATLSDIKFEEIGNLKNIQNLPDTIQFYQYAGEIRNNCNIYISFPAIWKSKFTGRAYRINKFTITFIPQSSLKAIKTNTINNSVLNSGKWYKIKIKNDGVYKITYSQIKKLGFVKPENVRIYGNGGAMLSYNTNTNRPNDLQENSISIEKGSDNVFNDGDFIIFYGHSTIKWYYDETKNRFVHTVHKYSDYNYYFITEGASGPKIIQNESSFANFNQTSISFDDFDFHESDEVNVIHSGREWYGDVISTNQTKTFSFLFPNIETSEDAYFYYNVISRASSMSYINFKVNSTSTQEAFGLVDLNNTTGQFANEAIGELAFKTKEGNNNISIAISLETNSERAEGYINFFGVNVRRKLILDGNLLKFRDSKNVGVGNITKYSIQNSNSDIEVWNITSEINPQRANTIYSSNLTTFISSSDSLKEFVAFNKKSVLGIEDSNFELIDNQNIHGESTPDMIIVCPNDTGFINQAKRLAKHRKDHDGLNSYIITLDKIYNEFSSGVKDITAIRDMIKMFFDKETGKLKYVLLFGDGTFINKQTVNKNNNYVPTYESGNSINYSSSYVTDDFYGWMNSKNNEALNLIEVGIGRLPVKSKEEAENVVNKIISYDDPLNDGEWQNQLCFIGDDQDGNTHEWQADKMAEYVDNNYPYFVIQKIYLDAYLQQNTALGTRYPEVNEAINKRINDGSLIINYTGHGSEILLAHEHIIEIPAIRSWTNATKLPLIVTATCEFGRFDNFNLQDGKEQTSAGEEVLLNANGGSVALLTTSRVVYSDENAMLNNAFYKYVFSKNEEGVPQRLGDVIRLTKNEIVNPQNPSINRLNFSLLGDPSTTLAYPKEIRIKTDSINGKSINNVDTLNALNLVRIAGHVENKSGNIKKDFNNNINVTIYDKVSYLTTLVNDEDSYPFTFKQRNSIIYKGVVKSDSGYFNFTFPIPLDIKYNYDFGKIIYFATDSLTTYSGANSNFIIGGLDNTVERDYTSPDIKLFMNDTNFISGGITNSNPKVLVILSDENGINTTGAGIGHDLTAILDNDFANMFTLNDYFKTDLNNYKKGSALYPLYNLEQGKHSIKAVGWDIFNNPSEKSIDFEVLGTNGLIVKKINNYPNPFSTKTYFVIEHNWPEKEINIEIKIFDLTGKVITVLKASGYSAGFRTSPLEWNGMDSNGHLIHNGIYLYKVYISDNKGNKAENFNKMIITR